MRSRSTSLFVSVIPLLVISAAVSTPGAQAHERKIIEDPLDSPDQKRSEVQGLPHRTTLGHQATTSFTELPDFIPLEAAGLSNQRDQAVPEVSTEPNGLLSNRLQEERTEGEELATTVTSQAESDESRIEANRTLTFDDDEERRSTLSEEELGEDLRKLQDNATVLPEENSSEDLFFDTTNADFKSTPPSEVALSSEEGSNDVHLEEALEGSGTTLSNSDNENATSAEGAFATTPDNLSTLLQIKMSPSTESKEGTFTITTDRPSHFQDNQLAMSSEEEEEKEEESKLSTPLRDTSTPTRLSSDIRLGTDSETLSFLDGISTEVSPIAKPLGTEEGDEVFDQTEADNPRTESTPEETDQVPTIRIPVEEPILTTTTSIPKLPETDEEICASIHGVRDEAFFPYKPYYATNPCIVYCRNSDWSTLIRQRRPELSPCDDHGGRLCLKSSCREPAEPWKTGLCHRLHPEWTVLAFDTERKCEIHCQRMDKLEGHGLRLPNGTPCGLTIGRIPRKCIQGICRISISNIY